MTKSNTQNSKALTARFVETVEAPGKYYDANGLFLRVRKAGSRQWVQRVTINGRRHELGLGSPPAVSLAAARKAALDNKGKAMLGEDPLSEKRAKRDYMTFSNAMENYLTAKLSEFRNEKHRKQWRSTLDTYAVPKLGALSVSEISVQDVLRVLQPIWSEKTETAKRLRGRIEAVLSWATVAGYRKGDNPARWKGNLSETLPKPAKIAQKENRPALSLDDLTRWWGDLSEREGMAARALQFLTLTAARSGEVRGLTWDELNLSLKASNGARVGVWTVPAARMKNKRQHTVPLSPEAVALLDTLPRMEGSPYVFFAQRGGMLSDMTISAVMRRIHAADLKAGRTGYLDRDSQRPAVPHGLRSTFRQWAAKQGYPRDMAEMALAHWIGSEVERAYQRHDMLDRRREMMQAWAAEVAGMKDDSVRNSKVSVLFN
jgi:integrase